jgi:hypothetical protein
VRDTQKRPKFPLTAVKMPRRLARHVQTAQITIVMCVCYLREDNDIDAERCRISLREKSPITLLTLDGAGHVVCFTGVVQSIQFDPNRAAGMRWRVEMELATAASTVR